MKPYERKRFLERINRDGATIGVTIPEELTVQEERIPLRTLVLELAHGEQADEHEERRETLISELRRERSRRYNRIKTEDIDRTEAEGLTDTILGIDRALEVLRADREGSIESEAMTRTQADRERWMRFLRKALGHDEAGKRFR